MAAITPLPVPSGPTQAPLRAAGGRGALIPAEGAAVRGTEPPRAHLARRWRRETGPERAVAAAARRRKGKGGASATPSSRHLLTTRAAIAPGQARGPTNGELRDARYRRSVQLRAAHAQSGCRDGSGRFPFV